jgi:hypothetical protein
VQVAQIHLSAVFFFERAARALSGQKIKCQIVSQRVLNLPFLRLTTHRAINPA